MARKASPRKPRITEEQISEMIRLQRQGKSISAIAQATGCHRQTVRTYLRERQADILADEVRKQVLIEELRSHFQELANFAAVGLKWRLKASRSEAPFLEVAMPGPISVAGKLGLLGSGSAKYAAYEWARMYEPSSREHHLTQALREHTKESHLWVHWDSWRKEVAEYETASRGLLQWVIDKTEPERFQKIDPEYMDSIRRWLFGNILRKTSGEDYERLENRGRDLTTPGAREVVVRAADSAGSNVLHEYLNSILKEAEQQPQWTVLQSATAQLREKQPKLKGIILEIDSALGGIELMRAFPGRCHLCPV
jgi:transposase-like protein